MHFIRVNRSISAIVAIAIVVTVFASAASARVFEAPGPRAQPDWPDAPPVVATVPGAPPALATVPESTFRAIEEQNALVRSYKAPPTARYSKAGIVAASKPAATIAVSAPKIAAPSDSFDWGDAAIGAATVVAIVLLVTGGAVMARRRMQVSEA